MIVGYVFWDPSRAVFPWNIPLLDRPILWYGVLFALAFFVGYSLTLLLMRRYLSHFSLPDYKQRAAFAVERLAAYVIIGTLVGARLGDILFYQDWTDLIHHPLTTLFRGDGLSSHGAAIGILASLFLYAKRMKRLYPMLTFLRLLDLVVIPTALAGVFIRIGNFINQEILGTASSVPWAVIFGHPADGGAVVPRHPAQLYEAAWLLVVWILLIRFWKGHSDLKVGGRIAGLFLVLVFTFRFCVEFFKVEQSVHLASHAPMTMGQWLSIPLIILGCALLLRKQPDQISRVRGVKRR